MTSPTKTRVRPAVPPGRPDTTTTRRLAGAGPADYMTALAARDLHVDPTYQRPPDDTRVAKLAAIYDPRLLGVLEVSARDDDRFAIIDGQHRWLLAQECDLRGPDTPLVCHVHLGLTVADEARLFHEIATARKNLTGWDKWHARRAAGDPVVADVERIANQAGFQAGPHGRKPWSLQSVSTCERILTAHSPDLLARVLQVIAAAWEGAPDGALQPILAGLTETLTVYDRRLDDTVLAAALATAAPGGLIDSAKLLDQVLPGPVGPRVATMIVRHYNRKVDVGQRIPDYLNAKQEARARARASRAAKPARTPVDQVKVDRAIGGGPL